MRASLIFAAHNEGDLLWRTLESVVPTSLGLQFEMVVADDASWDGCVVEAQKRFPEIRRIQHEERRGASPTKDLGARHARGEVLVFLDSHVKPELGALERLVEDVELCHGEAIITPAIGRLDPHQWRITDREHLGHGYWMDLETLDCRWVPLTDLRQDCRRGRRFYETPALMGCAFAIHRELYEKLRGFDPHMFCWGAEDLDLGLKGWLLGHPVLHDPEAIVGHRFQQKFENFEVPAEQLIANQLRLARKNFTESIWADWADRCRRRCPGKLSGHPEGLWTCAWGLFSQWQASVEYERSYLQARRVRDEFWYADRFGINWPRLQFADVLTEPSTKAPLAVSSESVSQSVPAPSPSDFIHWVDAIDDTYTIDAETGQASGNVITSENSDDGVGNDTHDGIPIVDTSSYTTTLIESPKHGQVILDQHGNFIYTPNAGSTEPDSFTYELSAAGGLTDQATVNVLCVANNDHEPRFDGPYTVEIPEDTAVDTEIITVVATDAVADSLAYSIIGGNDDGTFVINETTGEIRLHFALDYESVSGYTLTVKAMDTAGLSATTNVYVTVTDVNEPPVVPAETYRIDDGAVADTQVGTITAVDPEGESINTYAILEQKGVDSDGVETLLGTYFRIEKISGSDTASIHVADGITIDYDAYRSFRIKVQAYVVGGQFGDEWQVIKVLSPTNSPPVIDAIEVFDLFNDSAVGEIAAIIHAHDEEDGLDVKFEFVPGTDYGPFLLDRDTGILRVNGELDAETDTSYELQVRVLDSQFAFIDTSLLLPILAAANPQARVGMVVDNAAIEGNSDGFSIRFVRFQSNNQAPLPIRFMVDWRSYDSRFKDATIDDLNLSDDQRIAMTTGRVVIPSGQTAFQMSFYATRTTTRDKRPKQFRVTLVSTPDYAVISEPHGRLIDKDDPKQLSAYKDSLFTIYRGTTLFCPPAVNPQNEGDVHWNDVQQSFFDCYFMAAVIAVSRESENRIKRLFRNKFADRDGNYSVRLVHPKFWGEGLQKRTWQSPMELC